MYQSLLTDFAVELELRRKIKTILTSLSKSTQKEDYKKIEKNLLSLYLQNTSLYRYETSINRRKHQFIFGEIHAARKKYKINLKWLSSNISDFLLFIFHLVFLHISFTLWFRLFHLSPYLYVIKRKSFKRCMKNGPLVLWTLV